MNERNAEEGDSVTGRRRASTTTSACRGTDAMNAALQMPSPPSSRRDFYCRGGSAINQERACALCRYRNSNGVEAGHSSITKLNLVGLQSTKRNADRKQRAMTIALTIATLIVVGVALGLIVRSRTKQSAARTADPETSQSYRSQPRSRRRRGNQRDHARNECCSPAPRMPMSPTTLTSRTTPVETRVATPASGFDTGGVSSSGDFDTGGDM